MNQLKVSTRLLLLTGVLIALLLAVGSMGWYGIAQSNAALKTVYEDRTVPAAQLGEIRALILRNTVILHAALANPKPEVITAAITRVESNIAAVSKTWSAYMATYLTPEEVVLSKAFAQARGAFVANGLRPTMEALRTNDLPRAHQLLTETLEPLRVPVDAGLDALTQLQLDEAGKEYTQATVRYEVVRLATFSLIVGGLFFGILFAGVLVRSIMHELGAEPGNAANLARGVATGDLSVQIALRPGDTTSLMAQLKSMQDSLAGLVSQVRHNAYAVAAASAQIAVGNQDLSHRTERQASALEETAASLEELGSTMEHNTTSAHQAKQLAASASSIAEQGGVAVTRVVGTMRDIHASSRQISDIIGVIDGIAFQTNILALNAAVEAARAGEQGRGFAVVASEVRSLAGRSAVAAREIKALINASVERIAHGTALVDQAGATMTEVVQSIRRVSDIVGDISAADHAQTAGVQQIGEAVQQIDQTTQQNAALVEQMAAAASSLQTQADAMVQSVEVFKLADLASAGTSIQPMDVSSAHDATVLDFQEAHRAHQLPRPSVATRGVGMANASRHQKRFA